jgi:diguanylate cyclase (GGDEF)-like protein
MKTENHQIPQTNQPDFSAENWPFKVSPEQILHYLVHNCSAGFSIKNEDGEYLFANDSLAQHVGLESGKSLVGKTDHAFFPPDQVERFRTDEQGICTASAINNANAKVGKSLQSVSERADSRVSGPAWRLSTKELFAPPLFTPKAVCTLSQDITERKRLEDELRHYSETDGLTGIFNRRVFDMLLVREWDRARRGQYPLTLILLDVDFFKSYNDQYGHVKGDQVLKTLAVLMREQTKRPGDVACRYGGEEFAMLLPATDLRGAVTVGKRVTQGLEEKAIPHCDSNVSNVLTVSWGVATMYPGSHNQSEDLVKQADVVLYEAKKKGRNTFATWQEA